MPYVRQPKSKHSQIALAMAYPCPCGCRWKTVVSVDTDELDRPIISLDGERYDQHVGTIENRRQAELVADGYARANSVDLARGIMSAAELVWPRVRA